MHKKPLTQYIKKFTLILLLIFIPLSISAIKFKYKTKDGQEYTFQAIFDLGFSASAVSDAVGITDYETVFFRPAFGFEDFRIGLDINFRFKLFIGEVSFRTLDWYIPENSMLNAGLNTFFLYLDKIDYIRYGNIDSSPFFFNVGRNPVLTFGSGLVINNFHNDAFLPTSKEQGLVFKFNGNYLEKINGKNFPLDFTFLVTDLLDPDIFALDIGVDIFRFTKIKENFSLRAGFIGAFDINSTESNRVSSIHYYDITSHRNLSTTDYNLYTSFPLFTSIYLDFTWVHNIVKLNASLESGFLADFNSEYPTPGFGYGIKLGTEAKFINIKNSGHLLGVITGFIVESPHYFLDYFSSNYEVLRKKEYLALANNAEHNFYVIAGLGLYGLNERLKFQFTATMGLRGDPFICRFASKFIMEDTIVKGLFFSVYYETGMNAIYVVGEGGGFIDSITRDFRFAFEAGYKFYGAKLSVLIGVQRPPWVVPSISGNKENPYAALANGELLPYSTTTDKNSKYNWFSIDLDNYGKEIEKFVSLEISFVF